MLWGLGGKWLQNALRYPCKCTTLVYSISALSRSRLEPFVSAPDDSPLSKWFANRSDILFYILGCTLVGCWSSAQHQAFLFMPSHSRIWRGTGSALLHRLAWFTQVWARTATRDLGSVTLPWGITHFLWWFVYCYTVTQMNTMNFSYWSILSSPPSPNAKYKST